MTQFFVMSSHVFYSRLPAGFVGKLRLTLRLRSGGCLVSINELFLVSGPRTQFDYDEKREEDRAQEVKQKLLELLESKWTFSVGNSSCQDSNASYYSSYSTFLSFSTSLFANFTENLQFKIENVHLRYEDDTLGDSVESSAVMAGVKIRNLSIQSADENWEPTFITSDANHGITRKVVDLEGFSIYWDSFPLVSNILVDPLDRRDMVSKLKELLLKDQSNHEYLLEPVNGKAYLSTNLSPEPLRSRVTPRVAIDLKLEQIALSLTVVQYEQLLTIIDELGRRQRLLKNSKWRPKVSIKEDPKSWWFYAIDANIDDWRNQRKRDNWTFVINRCSIIKRYCDVYMNMIVQPEDTTRRMKAIRDEIETDLSFEELRILRELVYERYQKLHPEDDSTATTMTVTSPTAASTTTSSTWSFVQSWLPGWFSSSEPAEDSAVSPTDEGVENMSCTSNFEDELLDVLKDASDDTRLTRGAVFTQLNISLNKASAVLIADPKYLKTSSKKKVHHKRMQHIMEVELTQPFVTIDQEGGVGIICILKYMTDRGLLRGVSSLHHHANQHKQTQLKIGFRHLNILLLRSIKMSQGRKRQEKVATASFSGATIMAKSGQEVSIEVSLKRGKVTDMSSSFSSSFPTSSPHTYSAAATEIIKIGKDKGCGGSNISKSSSPNAITFTLKRTISENLLDVNLTLVSPYYFHSPALLRELASCAEEFKSYMSKLANAINIVAEQVAKDPLLTPQPKKDHASSSAGRKVKKISYVKDLRVLCSIETPMIVLPTSHSFIRGIKRFFNPKPGVFSRDSFTATLYECLGMGLDITNGTIRLVDNSNPDLPLIEGIVKEMYIFGKSQQKDNNGNIRGVTSALFYNPVKRGWEPLAEAWKFVLRWDSKTEKLGKDGILLKSSAGETKRATVDIESSETLNFNVTPTTLDLFHALKRKWDAVILDDPEPPVDLLALTASPDKLIVREQRRHDYYSASEWRALVDIQNVGFSFVNHLNEELLYISLSFLIMEYVKTESKHSFNCSVKNIQVDNQLREHQKEVVMHPMFADERDPMLGQPALSISFQKGMSPHLHYFPEFQVKCKDVVFNLEELLLLKLYEFFGYPWEGTRALDRAVGHLANQAVASSITKSTSFVYVVFFEIVLKHIRLSVYTSSHLPLDLTRLKETLNLSLVSFEDAKVRLQAFRKETSLNTVSSLWSEIVDHYKKQLQRQAARILGSVDFLGNPIGLLSDVSEGVSHVAEGNVGGLVTSVAHGLSNSSAKFMSSLSNTLDATTLDSRHQEIRRRIHQENRDHFRTGIRGFGVGIMGGVTSIVTQTFDGVVNNGVEGMVSGFGKGLLGTFTKPVVGVLDFAAGVSGTVRDTVRHHNYQRRRRPPRVCTGHEGLLPPYDEEQALGQQYFYESAYIRDRDEWEVFTSFRQVSSQVACVISTTHVRFLTWNLSNKRHGHIILSLSFNDVIKCNTESKNITPEVTVPFIVMIVYEYVIDEEVSADFPSFGPSNDVLKRKREPSAHRIQCSSNKVALNICQLVNLAKSAFDRSARL